MLERRLYYVIYLAIFILMAGIFTSVSILSLYHILILIPGFYFTKKYLEEGYRLPLSSYALVCLVFAGVASNLINFENLVSPLKNFGKLKYFIFAIIAIFPLKAIFKNYFGARQIKILLNVLFITIIAAAIYGIFKFRLDYNIFQLQFEYTKQDRVGGFTGIMRYGYGMSFILTLLTGLFIYRTKLSAIISPKLFYLTLIFGFIGFILSFTRGAALGYLCSLPFILGFYKKKWGMISLGIVFFTVTFVVSTMIYGGHQSSRFLLKITHESNLKRLSLYETALVGISEKPFFGHGVNQFSSECSRLKDKYGIWWKNYCKRIGFTCKYFNKENEKHFCSHSHNVFLEILNSVGIFGFIFFLAWFFTWSYELIRRKDLLSVIYLPFIINFLISSQFEMVFDANNSFLIFFLYPLSFIKKEDLGTRLKFTVPYQ